MASLITVLALLAVIALGYVVTLFKRIDDLPAPLLYQDTDYRYEIAGITSSTTTTTTSSTTSTSTTTTLPPDWL